MPRSLRGDEARKRTQARRDFALERQDLRQPSVRRQPAVGATSPAVKARDASTDRQIEEFLKRQPRVDNGEKQEA